MSQPVVVVTPSPSAPSAPSAGSPEVAPEIVEVIHDDARDLGFALSELGQHSAKLADFEMRIISLEGIASAQASATAAIVEAVEETQETVEEIAESVTDDDDSDTDADESAPEEIPDTVPGKPHWLRRSAKSWRGKE